MAADLQERLRDLRSRIEQNPALAGDLTPAAAALEAAIAAIEQQRRETEWRLRVLENGHRTLDVHVAALEDSLIFRFLRSAGKPLLEWNARIDRWRRRFQREPAADPAYESWRQEAQMAGEAAALAIEARPLFSVVLRVQNPQLELLEEAVGSVLRQTYPNWELSIYADDVTLGSLEKYRGEPRIRICSSTGLSGPAERADYITFLGQHDVLSPLALHGMAEALQRGPAGLLYTDEDHLSPQGRHVDPVFKPDWSPELLLSCPYIGRLMAVSREAFERAGGIREGFTEYDLALRLTDHPITVHHIPQVLYHARTKTGPPDHRALEDAIRRRNWRASVEAGPSPDRHHVCWTPQGEPLASLIVCSRSPALAERCLGAIRKRTAYSRREAIVLHHVTAENEAAMEKVILRNGARHVRYSGPFHFSRMNNLAANAAEGEILVFLNDDVEPLVDSWLADLIGQAQRPEIGAVGARLLYPSGALQHAGISIGIGDGCGHVGRGVYFRAYWPWLDATRDVSAVTGACLAIRRELFAQVGGFDDRFPVNYNDADLCLRLRRAGYRIVCEAAAVLKHDECRTRQGRVTLSERQRWYSRWADEIDKGDPFYSPNLTRMREDASLRSEL